MTGPATEPLSVGSVVELTAGDVAHGGHVVARADTGQVVFLRHAIPGERVQARITGVGPQGRYLWADAITVLQASADRVTAPCPASGPGRCGGCDWQHVAMARQHMLKTQVVADAMVRFAGLSPEEVSSLQAQCQPLPGDVPEGSGLGWRDRVRYATTEDGALAMRAHRSHGLIPVGACLLGTASVQQASHVWAETPHSVPAGTAVEIVDSGRDAAAVVLVEGVATDGRARVQRHAAGRSWQVRADGFWQRHVSAADHYARRVRELVAAAPGERVWDLYSGTGLFAVTLAADVGVSGRIDAVEADPHAGRDARRNAHDARQVHIHTVEVEQWLTTATAPVDVVVLDPPRAGAGRTVLEGVLERAPRLIVYVACDPVALARDTGQLRGRGWQLAHLEVWDAFPMTHHVEAIATFMPVHAGT